MKKYLPIFLSCFSVISAFAQGEANVWYFGFNAGVDFNGGSPVALTNGQMSTGEGCAVISDKNGQLLFYTDGQRIWNRNHVQMTNGYGLNGHASATQSGVIVPRPGAPNRFYIFTVGGLGDVVTATKNTLLFTGSTEKITAVRHANGLYF